MAKASQQQSERGFVYENGKFRPDCSGSASLTLAQLEALLGADGDQQGDEDDQGCGCDAPVSSITFTCVPPGSGYRIGIDRDADGIADGDEH